MAVAKKKLIKSLETLPEDLKDLVHEQYPNGYEASITRITNAKKEPIFVFPIETEDAVVLVKVPVTKNSDGGYDMESSEREEFDPADDVRGGNEDDFDNSGDSDGDGFDDEGGNGGKEASYDPDFDN